MRLVRTERVQVMVAPVTSSALLQLLLLLLLALPSSDSSTNVTVASCPKPDDPNNKPDDPPDPDDPGHGGMFNCTDMPPRAPIPAARRNPVMLVPSMLGSFLQRKLHNSHEPYPVCQNGGWLGGADWWNMWPPAGLEPDCKSVSCMPSDWWPIYADCWAHDLTLDYGTCSSSLCVFLSAASQEAAAQTRRRTPTPTR